MQNYVTIMDWIQGWKWWIRSCIEGWLPSHAISQMLMPTITPFATNGLPRSQTALPSVLAMQRVWSWMTLAKAGGASVRQAGVAKEVRVKEWSCWRKPHPELTACCAASNGVVAKGRDSTDPKAKGIGVAVWSNPILKNFMDYNDPHLILQNLLVQELRSIEVRMDFESCDIDYWSGCVEIEDSYNNSQWGGRTTIDALCWGQNPPEVENRSRAVVNAIETDGSHIGKLSRRVHWGSSHSNSLVDVSWGWKIFSQKSAEPLFALNLPAPKTRTTSDAAKRTLRIILLEFQLAEFLARLPRFYTKTLSTGW